MTGMTHLFPALALDPEQCADHGDPPRLGPPLRAGASGRLGIYVAAMLREGRDLFDILGDRFIQERADDEPDLLGALATDPLVHEALQVQQSFTGRVVPEGRCDGVLDDWGYAMAAEAA
jgi:hypothetical protein